MKLVRDDEWFTQILNAAKDFDYIFEVASDEPLDPADFGEY